MLSITSAQRRALRARAHALDPVVAIGDKGLTSTVYRELETSLVAHELIKVRASDADRKARAELLSQICTTLNAAPVQHIGKILVIYRPASKQTPASTEHSAPEAD